MDTIRQCWATLPGLVGISFLAIRQGVHPHSQVAGRLSLDIAARVPVLAVGATGEVGLHQRTGGAAAGAVPHFSTEISRWIRSAMALAWPVTSSATISMHSATL